MSRFFTPSLIIVILVVLGGVIFKSLTPDNCANVTRDSALFVLTGDARRIPFAIKLLRTNNAKSLYIIGAGGQWTFGDLKDKVHVESDSKNTYENALAIKDIVQSRGLYNIVIITTEDHLNRAMKLIRHELPDTNITGCPVPLSNMPVRSRLGRWGMEYFKYIGTTFGFKTRG